MFKKICALFALGILTVYLYAASSGNTGTGLFVLQTSPTTIGLTDTTSLTAPTFDLLGGAGNANFQMTSYGANDNYFSIQHANGTQGSPTASTTADALGYWTVQGYTGSSFQSGGLEIFYPTQTWTATAWGTKMNFYVTPNNSTTNFLALELDQDGEPYFPGLVASSAATSGAVCYTSSNGLLNYDHTTTCLASSARFKHTIAQWTGSGLSIIDSLTPVTFTYNQNLGLDYPNQHIGLIAEDVAKVEPRLVDNAAAPNKINIQDLVSVLVKAVQEQQAQITALKNALTAANISIPAVAVSPSIYVPPNVTPYIPPPPLTPAPIVLPH